MIEYRSIRVALLGAGSVGSQVARLLIEQGDELANRIGARLELVGIAVRDVDAARDADLAQGTVHDRRGSRSSSAPTSSSSSMGGIEPARTLVLQAIASGAPTS